MAKRTVEWRHDPVVLRVDEMVDGEVGKVARQVGEITLARGSNEVDGDLLEKWMKNHAKNPLAQFMSVEEPKGEVENG